MFEIGSRVTYIGKEYVIDAEDLLSVTLKRGDYKFKVAKDSERFADIFGETVDDLPDNDLVPVEVSKAKEYTVEDNDIEDTVFAHTADEIRDVKQGVSIKKSLVKKNYAKLNTAEEKSRYLFHLYALGNKKKLFSLANQYDDFVRVAKTKEIDYPAIFDMQRAIDTLSKYLKQDVTLTDEQIMEILETFPKDERYAMLLSVTNHWKNLGVTSSIMTEIFELHKGEV